MTANQSAQLVKNPATKKAIAVLERFAKLEAEYKAIEKEEKAARELIKEAMIAGGVEKITIDTGKYTGYITLVEKISYKAEDLDEVPEEFLKPTLDTTKVKAQATLTGSLPNGVTELRSQFITKRLKAVE